MDSKNETKVLEWQNQRLDLNQIEALWRDEFYKEKFLHSDVKESLPLIENAWLWFLLPRMAQPVIRKKKKLNKPGRGQKLFHSIVSINFSACPKLQGHIMIK